DPEAGINVMVFERAKGDRPPSPRREPPRIPAASGTTLPSATPLMDPPKLDAPRPPERDLHKEIDQLREQLRRMEKLLQERPPARPTPTEERSYGSSGN